MKESKKQKHNRRKGTCQRCNRPMTIQAKNMCAACYQYTKYPDYFKQKAKQWRLNNKEKNLEYRRKRYHANLEKVREYARNYAKYGATRKPIGRPRKK
jgi:hypothetical protein